MNRNSGGNAVEKHFTNKKKCFTAPFKSLVINITQFRVAFKS